MIRVLDSAGSTLVEWGRQQQQQPVSDVTNDLCSDVTDDLCSDITNDLCSDATGDLCSDVTVDLCRFLLYIMHSVTSVCVFVARVSRPTDIVSHSTMQPQRSAGL